MNEYVITQLTNNDTDDLFPQIDGNNIVWEIFDGNDNEIFFYNGSEIINLSDNDTSDFSPQIDGNNIVWEEFDGNDNEIFVATPILTVYRFFNNDTGVHFYTADEDEKESIENELPNFSFEGASYTGVDVFTGQSEVLPVYRLLNQDTGVHLYTIDENERNTVEDLANFSFEGEVFYAYSNEVGMEVEGTIPIFRFFNTTTGAHFYTSSEAERDNVNATLPDFQSEGIAYYALPIE